MNLHEIFYLFDTLFEDEDPRLKGYFRMKLTEILERRGVRFTVKESEND